MMAAIDGSPPDPNTDQCEGSNDRFALVAANSVKGCYQHIGRVQRRNGCKYIGVFAVEGMEDGDTHELIEPAQSCHVTRRMQQRFETVQHNVPGRCGRMYIIASKTNEVNEKKSRCKVKIMLVIAFQIEKQSEADRYRYPTKVEETGPQIDR